MKCNVGNADKSIRLVLGVLIIGFGILNNSWFGLLGLVPIATAAMGWCPAYVPFGLNTCSKKPNLLQP